MSPEMRQEDAGRAATGVLGRAVTVLRIVDAHEPVGISSAAVSRLAQMPRSTTDRLLASLWREGLVDRGESARWVLGPELVSLGATAILRASIHRDAERVVADLVEALGTGAYLASRREDETACVISRGGMPSSGRVPAQGARHPIAATAPGVAMLAFDSDEAIERCLVATGRGDGGPHLPETARGRVEQARRLGFSVLPSPDSSTWTVAAAVFDPHGHARWALALTGISSRCGEERGRDGLVRLHHYGAAVHRAARTLTRAQRVVSVDPAQPGRGPRS